MTVTDFRMTKRGKIALYVDGEFLLSLHPDVFAASGLSVGSAVDVDSLEELSAEAELKKAKEKALTLLSYKEYTTRELETRLQQHVDEDSAALAVERMEELGLLNDEDYARRFARDLSERRHYGVLRVKQEMRRKGLSPEQIEDALSLLENDPVEEIRALIEKKYPLYNEDEKVKKRAFAAMLRRGFTVSEVRQAFAADEYYD